MTFLFPILLTLQLSHSLATPHKLPANYTGNYFEENRPYVYLEKAEDTYLCHVTMYLKGHELAEPLSCCMVKTCVPIEKDRDSFRGKGWAWFNARRMFRKVVIEIPLKHVDSTITHTITHTFTIYSYELYLDKRRRKRNEFVEVVLADSPKDDFAPENHKMGTSVGHFGDADK